MAHDTRSARTRAHRHLQPFLLRRSVDRARAPKDSARRSAKRSAWRHKTFWKQRYRSIRNLEQHLHASGTRVVKFFLHLSKEEQRKRFLARIDDPEKNWKFSMADVEERRFWKEYRSAYEDCLSQTSTKDSPWYVVPADDKLNARLIVSSVLLDTLQDLKMSYPPTSDERREELQKIRKQLS